MYQSCVDKIKAEIITSQLKISWSVITGNLESIITLPENFEWVGKSSINICFQKQNNEKIPFEISDLDFSEYYDEKSFGILQTVYLNQNRLKILYYGLKEIPVIFIEFDLLINIKLPEYVNFIPFCFNINKKINSFEIKQIETNDKELSYIITDTGNGLLFYVERGGNIKKVFTNNNEIQNIYIEYSKNEYFNSKSNIKLPKMYICPFNIALQNDVKTLHYKIIDAHSKYEKWAIEKI